MRYLGFFEAFNRQQFFEAHEILEALWLPLRKAPIGDFYKGLIQLAGAFVHFQKDRRQPAGALLRLARNNLARFPTRHEGLNLDDLLTLVGQWEHRLTNDPLRTNPYRSHPPPRLDPPHA